MNLMHRLQVSCLLLISYANIESIVVHGLKIARHTGRAMSSTGLVADVCLSSTALRCIQTAERVLTGKIDFVFVILMSSFFA